MQVYRNLVLLFYSFVQVQSAVYNSSITDFSKCKVHYSRSESTYRNFYSVTEKPTSNENLTLDFHFSVLAPRDAHILLSPSANIHRSDPVYEIVLGAGSNTFCDIRRMQKAAVKTSARTTNLLSSLDIRSFWIHISKDGLIEIGKEGNELAFLTWKDSDPLPIQVFSFCTWPGVEAKWFYDCQREDGTVSESQEIQKPLSPREKLKNEVLKNYDPYSLPFIHPDDLLILHMSTKYDRIYLNEFKSKIIVEGVMNFIWLDEKISWDPTNHSNIQKLNINFREIWIPDLVVYNSARGPGTGFLKPTSMVVNSDGQVIWNTQMHIEAWCDAYEMGHWPNDEHKCDIQLGLWVHDKDIVFHVVQNSTNMFSTHSEWEVVDYTPGYYLIPTPWKNIEENLYGTSYVIQFKLRRLSQIYTVVYFAPVVVVAISLLATFWLPPVGSYRVSIHCFQLILLAGMLTRIGSILPAHPTSAPYIVQVYSYGMIAVVIALVFSIFLINLNEMHYTKPLPYFLYVFLNFRYIQNILYVRATKFSESYDNLIDGNNTKDIDIKEMWILLGVAIDRLLFIIYFFLVIICLAKEY